MDRIDLCCSSVNLKLFSYTHEWELYRLYDDLRGRCVILECKIIKCYFQQFDTVLHLHVGWLGSRDQSRQRYDFVFADEGLKLGHRDTIK